MQEKPDLPQLHALMHNHFSILTASFFIILSQMIMPKQMSEEAMQILMRPWGHMHFVDEGPKDAPPILFANSLGTDLRMWEARHAPTAQPLHPL